MKTFSYALALIAMTCFSACQSSDAPSTDIEKAVSDSLLEYSAKNFTFKSFAQKSSRKGTENGQDITFYTGDAVVTTKSDGMIAPADYKGDGTHHRWSKYIQKYRNQTDFAAFTDDVKATWTNGGHAVKAGTDIEVTDVTVGCWFGKTQDDNNKAWRCYRPKND